MRDDLSRNILTERYGAQVREGQYRWRDTVPRYSYPVNLDDGDFRDIHLQVVEVRSVQVDLHPADFKRLVDFLDYAYNTGDGMTATQVAQQRTNPMNGYAEHFYKKQWREEELRKQHPLLQDLWQQYQMTLNLIASGQPIGTE